MSSGSYRVRDTEDITRLVFRGHRHGYLDEGKRIVLPGSRTLVDDVGIARRTERWRINSVDQFAVAGRKRVIPGRRSPHALFPNLLLREYEVEEEGAGLAVVSLLYTGYEGEINDGVGGDGEVGEPVYELRTVSSTEPIEGHPNWEEIKEEGNPVYEQGLFVGFDADSGAIAGLTHYDDKRLVWSKRYVSTVAPDMSKRGKIDQPEGPAPWSANDLERNWRLADIAYEQEGHVFSVTKTWEQSAPGGWLPSVYDY